jgi:hypothetical protein
MANENEVRVTDSVQELIDLAPNVDPLGMVLLGFSEPAMLKYAKESKFLIPIRALASPSAAGIVDITKPVREVYVSNLVNAFAGAVDIKVIHGKKGEIAGFFIGQTMKVLINKSARGLFPTISVFYCPSKTSLMRTVSEYDVECEILDHNEFILGPDVSNDPESTSLSMSFVWARESVEMLESRGRPARFIHSMEVLISHVRKNTDEVALRTALMNIYADLFRAVYVRLPPILAFVSSVETDVAERRLTINYIITNYHTVLIPKDIISKITQLLNYSIEQTIKKLALSIQEGNVYTKNENSPVEL